MQPESKPEVSIETNHFLDLLAERWNAEWKSKDVTIELIKLNVSVHHGDNFGILQKGMSRIT